MRQFLFTLLRKPVYSTTNVRRAVRSKMQFGVEELFETNVYTLSLLGIINGLPLFSRRYLLILENVIMNDKGCVDYSKARLRIRKWR